MINLTLKEKDKDNFITGFALKEDTSEFIISYASKREEKVPFSFENLNNIMSTMEEQYFKFREDYIKGAAKASALANLKMLAAPALSIISLYLAYNTGVNKSILNYAAILLTIASSIYIRKQSLISNIITRNSDIVYGAEYFVKNKDKFKVSVTDPITGQNAYWYFLNLSNIEKLWNGELVFKSEYLSNICAISDYANSLTEADKEKERTKISERLKLIKTKKETQLTPYTC